MRFFVLKYTSVIAAGEDSPVFAPFIRDADLAVRGPWRVPQRRLLDYLLIYVQEGRCRFEVEGIELFPARGEFCLVQPGQRVVLQGLTHTVTPYAHFDLAYRRHRDESFATRPGQMNLEAYGQLLQPSLSAFGGALPILFRPREPEAFALRWLQVVRDWNHGGRLQRLQADGLLGQLMLQLMVEFSNAAPPLQSNALSFVPSFLSARLADAITVPQMAQRAGLSLTRFHLVFKSTYGCSPARYLAQLRVDHAAELLATTNWKLAHIAALCGFADVHHLAHAFRKARGLTPGQHRAAAGEIPALGAA